MSTIMFTKNGHNDKMESGDEMEQSKIDRINELAKKSREQGLSEQEKEEQAKLRQEYVQAFKSSLVSQLESTYIVDEHGNKKKVERKIKKDDTK